MALYTQNRFSDYPDNLFVEKVQKGLLEFKGSLKLIFYSFPPFLPTYPRIYAGFRARI